MTSETDNQTTQWPDSWLRHHGLSILRLRVDIKGASYTPIKRAGDLVLGRWRPGDRMIAEGFLIQDIGFLCVCRDPDVEVVRQP